MSHVTLITTLVVLAHYTGWIENLFSSPLTAFVHLSLVFIVGFASIPLIGITLLVVFLHGMILGNELIPVAEIALGISALAGIGGIYSAALMHHASHNSFSTSAKSRLIGEICALHQLVGFYGWQIPHIAHHRSSDILGEDPHAPGTSSFLSYSSKIKSDVLSSLKKAYLETFPDATGITSWASILVWIWTNRVIRTLFWYALLGPELFVCFFMTSYFAQLLFYVHFNWSTHKSEPDGSVAIRDLDNGFYYKLINRFMWGMFYHGTHHEFPSLKDPREAQVN